MDEQSADVVTKLIFLRMPARLDDLVCVLGDDRVAERLGHITAQIGQIHAVVVRGGKQVQIIGRGAHAAYVARVRLEQLKNARAANVVQTACGVLVARAQQHASRIDGQ